MQYIFCQRKSKSEQKITEIYTSPPSTSPEIPPVQRSSQSRLGALNACIYRVPKAARKGKEDAYTPQIISIGPFHHNNRDLQRMNEHKNRFLKAFLEKSSSNKQELLECIERNEERLRNCYFESVAFNNNQLAEIVLKDAAFILEFFYRICFRLGEDALTSKTYIVNLILCDMVLLENQLPLFMINELLDLASIRAPPGSCLFREDRKVSLPELIFGAFGRIPSFRVSRDRTEGFDGCQISHFLDFIRICHLPPCGGSERNPYASKKARSVRLPGAMKLQQAGVRFKKSESKNLYDVTFNSKKGIFEIPYVELNRNTELLFQNLVIFEQLHYFGQQHFTDYMHFLDFLVDEPNDVEILADNHIIGHGLADDNAAATLLNNIAKSAIRGVSTKSYFAEIYDDLRSYYGSPRQRLMANLKQKYLNFRSPWAGISVLAAFVLLVLTFVQTVFTIIK